MLWQFNKGRLTRVLGLDALTLSNAFFILSLAVLLASLFSKQIFGTLITIVQALGW